MLLSLNFLKGLELNLKLRFIIGTTPFYVTRKTSELPNIVICSNRQLKWQWTKLIITSAFAALLWFQVVEGRSTQSLITTLESLMNVFAITIFILMNCVYLKRNRFLVNLFNSLIQYESNHPFDFTGIISKREKLVINYIQFNGFMAAPVIIGAYVAQRWFTPCTSATLAWNVLDECFIENPFENGFRWSFKSYIYLVVIVILSWWILSDLLAGFAFQAVEVAYLQSACLVGYVKHFKQKLQNIGTATPKLILEYQQLQILTIYYNFIQQDVIISLMLTLIICLTIVCSYVLIKLGSGISVSHFLFFSCALVDSLATMVICYGQFGCLHTQSTSVLTIIRSQIIPNVASAKISYNDLKLMKKYVESFYPLKVQLGSVNFVEKITPLVSLQFCVEQLVNLLII
ncbi:unnamed protein product [Orchesella dallaii]|uniref:Gustatory receptor n=1 Tax=Orchesella dallaii TaxID=48710 RepID=A0ABP1QDE6_9HEXA